MAANLSLECIHTCRVAMHSSNITGVQGTCKGASHQAGPSFLLQTIYGIPHFTRLQVHHQCGGTLAGPLPGIHDTVIAPTTTWQTNWNKQTWVVHCSAGKSLSRPRQPQLYNLSLGCQQHQQQFQWACRVAWGWQDPTTLRVTVTLQESTIPEVSTSRH